MKRIVILCDGTWNRSDCETPTNVVRLGQILEPFDKNGCAQIPIYVPGVGTGVGTTRFSRKMNELLGGSLGLGLMSNIEEAYRHLVFLYCPGDEIYIFGYSRGAYTARSLTGLIRSTGILRKDQLHRTSDAINRYQDASRVTKPSSGESHEFRADISPDVATSVEEVNWRARKNLKEPHLLKIKYLGVWDSVGALGIPSHFAIAPLINRRKYSFHDTQLSSMVGSARHAVALDEKRRSFKPTCWENIDDLNKQAEASDESALYQEKYFAGDHGSVGGGGDIEELSSIALCWIAEGAHKQGLVFDETCLVEIRKKQNPFGPLRNTKNPPRGLSNYIMRRSSEYRHGPERLSQLHTSVLDRFRDDCGNLCEPYRPGSLSRLEDEILSTTKEPTAA